MYAWKVFLKIQRRRKARQARQTIQTELERRRNTIIGYEDVPLYYTDQLAEGQEAVFVPLERRLGEARSARMPSRRIFTRWRPNGANNAGMDNGNDGSGDGDGDGSDAAIAALGAAVNPLNPLSTWPRERERCALVWSYHKWERRKRWRRASRRRMWCLLTHVIMVAPGTTANHPFLSLRKKIPLIPSGSCSESCCLQCGLMKDQSSFHMQALAAFLHSLQMTFSVFFSASLCK